MELDKQLERLKAGNYVEASKFLDNILISLLKQAGSKVGVENNRQDGRKSSGSIDEDNFWGYAFTYVQKVIDLTFDAVMAVGYKNNNFYLIFNPAKIEDDWTVENLVAIVKHEGYHLLFDHLNIYAKAEYPYLMNVATDCEINQHLVDLPEGCITVNSVKQMTGLTDVKEKAGSKYYYELLLQNADPQGSSGNESEDSDGEGSENESNSGNGSGEKSFDSHDEWRKSVKEESNNYIPSKEAAKNLFNQVVKDMEKKRGTVPGNLQQLIDKLNEKAQVPWQHHIQRQMGKQICSKRKSPNRLNRRDPKSIYKKGLLNDRLNPIAVAFDVSGSVSDKELSYFFNEITAIAKKLKVPMYYIEFDSEVKNVYTIDSAKKIKYEVKGRGGTSFQPVFDYLKENNFDKETQLFIFTDGGGESHIHNRGYKKYQWVLTDNNNLSVVNEERKIIRLDCK